MKLNQNEDSWLLLNCLNVITFLDTDFLIEISNYNLNHDQRVVKLYAI